MVEYPQDAEMPEDAMQVAVLADYTDVVLRLRMVEALVDRAARNGWSLSEEDWARLAEAAYRDPVASRAKIPGRSPQRPRPPSVVEHRPASSEPPDPEPVPPSPPVRQPPAPRLRRLAGSNARVLSARRAQIVQMLADDMTQVQIAVALGVTHGSVKHAVAASLDVSRQESAHGLVAWAARNGYLDEPTGETPLARPSDREMETLILLASGRTVIQIARATYVSPNTVQTRLARLRDKLGARTASGLIGAAWRCGLLHAERAVAA